MLTQPGYQGESLSLSGPEPLVPDQQVGILAEVLGRPLRYEPRGDARARADMHAA